MTGRLVQLGQVAEFVRGVTYKPEDLMANFSAGSVVCMRTANVQAELDESDLRSIPVGLVKSTDKLLREGDILVSTANSWNLVGKCCWVPNLSYPAAPGGFIAALRADPAKICPRYLYHWFNSPKTQADARNCGRQTTNISNMDLGRCLTLEIPLPAMSEQRRIAAILDKADALRAKRRESIAKLDRLLQSIFIEIFGDPASNPNRWPKFMLGELSSVQTGNTPPTSSSEFFDGPIPFVTPSDLGGLVKSSRRTLSSDGARRSRTVPAGSSLVCCIGATIGKVGLATRECAFNQQINAVTWRDGVDPIYGFYALRFLSAEIARRGSSTTLPIINKSDFERIDFIVPQFDKQIFFSKIAISIQSQGELFEQVDTRFQDLFQSIQKEFFAPEGGCAR